MRTGQGMEVSPQAHAQADQAISEARAALSKRFLSTRKAQENQIKVAVELLAQLDALGLGFRCPADLRSLATAALPATSRPVDNPPRQGKTGWGR